MKEAIYKTCPVEKKLEILGLHTAFVREADVNYSSQGEFHNFWEFVFVLKGELWIKTDTRTCIVGKNQAILHKPMEYHQHANFGENENRFAVLSFDAQMPPTPEDVLHLTLQQTQLLTELIHQIREIHEIEDDLHIVRVKQQKNLSQQKIIQRVEMLLIDILNQKEELHNNSSEYEKIVDVINKRLEENLSLEELAEKMHMSPSNLKRIFSRHYQGGIMQYYRQMQMDRAVLLMQEGLSVCQASEKLNFISQSAFCNAFKRVYGTAPTKYLKSLQKTEKTQPDAR